MLIGVKDVDSTIEITAIFSSPTTGADTDPDTSIVIDIYPANSDTQVVTAQAMTKKDSVTGFYKYAWDVSSVDAGLYIYKIKVVHDSVTYSAKGEVLIQDTSIDTIDGKVDTIDTNVDTIDTNIDLVLEAGVGNGNIPYLYQLREEGTTTGVPGVWIWLSTDVNGSNVVTPKRRTNDSGLVMWYMRAGIYYVWTSYSTDSIGQITVA